MTNFDFEKELKELSRIKDKKPADVGSPKGKRDLKLPLMALAIVVLIGLWLLLRPSDKSTDTKNQSVVTNQQVTGTGADVKDSNNIKSQEAQHLGAPKESSIKGIRLRPTNPTILDPIKAEVDLNSPSTQDRIHLKYQWLINNTSPIEGVDGDTLPAGKVKRGNYVGVRVIEIRDGEIIAQKNSDMVMVHNSAPSLTMRILNSRIKKGDPIEIQLSANDPDGDTLTFSLDEAPSGMTLDPSSGKITYRPDSLGHGAIKFRASVTDSEGAKTSGSYEVNFDVQ
jgi:hypothetical protein